MLRTSTHSSAYSRGAIRPVVIVVLVLVLAFILWLLRGGDSQVRLQHMKQWLQHSLATLGLTPSAQGVHLQCSNEKSLSDALNTLQSDSTITIDAPCLTPQTAVGGLVIGSDKHDITIDGNGSLVIKGDPASTTPVLTLDGAKRIKLRKFKIQDGLGDGLVIKNGSIVALSEISVSDTKGPGVVIRRDPSMKATTAAAAVDEDKLANIDFQELESDLVNAANSSRSRGSRASTSFNTHGFMDAAAEPIAITAEKSCLFQVNYKPGNADGIVVDGGSTDPEGVTSLIYDNCSGEIKGNTRHGILVINGGSLKLTNGASLTVSENYGDGVHLGSPSGAAHLSVDQNSTMTLTNNLNGLCITQGSDGDIEGINTISGGSYKSGHGLIVGESPRDSANIVCHPNNNSGTVLALGAVCVGGNGCPENDNRDKLDCATAQSVAASTSPQ